MFFFCAIIILAVGVALIVVNGAKDFLHPSRLFPAFIIITNVPFLIYAQFDPSILHYAIRSNIVDNSFLIGTLFALYMTAFLIAHAAGTLVRFQFSVPQLADARFSITVVLYGIAVGLSIMLFVSLGGFRYWQSDVRLRTFIVERNLFQTTFVTLCLWFATIFTLQWALNKKRLVGWMLFLSIFTVSSFFLGFTGSRKGVIWLSIFGVVYYLWNERRIRWSYAGFAALALTIYVLVVGALRATGASAGFSGLAIFEHALLNLISSISYTSTYLFIVDHFTHNPLWWGSQYAVIPMNLLGSHVLGDDGVTIRALAFGFDVEPTEIPHYVYLSSWPPETFGSAFANFHVGGLGFFGFLLGMVHNAAYRIARAWNPSPFGVLLYGFFFLNFQFSNLRFVQVAVFLIILTGLIVVTQMTANRLPQGRGLVSPART